MFRVLRKGNFPPFLTQPFVSRSDAGLGVRDDEENELRTLCTLDSVWSQMSYRSGHFFFFFGEVKPSLVRPIFRSFTVI